MKVEPIVRCSDCGSRDPHVTIGWPVCPNDDFHQEWEFKVPWWRKTYHRRPALVASLLLALLPVAAYFSGKAHADPGPTVVDYVASNGQTVCQLIDERPVVNEIEVLVEALVAKGFTAYEAGQIIGMSVAYDCPANQPVVNAFIRKYAGGRISQTFRA